MIFKNKNKCRIFRDNKIKFIISVLLCVLISHVNLYAQKLQWSVPQKVSERAYITESLGENNGVVFVVKKNSRGQEHDIILDRYSEDMRKTITKVFLTHRNENFIRVILDSTGLRMFYSSPDKDKKHINVILKNLNFNLEEMGKDTTLFSIEGTNIEQALITAYKMKMSPYILITYTKDNGEYPTNYEYVLLDGSIKNVSQGTFNLGAVNKSSIEQVTFSSEKFGLLVREDVKQKLSRLGYQFYIYDGKFGDPEMNRTRLFSDSFSITEGILKTDFKNSNMVFAGLYATRDSSYVKGCYVWRKSLKTNTLFTRSNPFTSDIIIEMEGRRNKLQGIFNLRAGDMTFRADGGMILTSEEYQETHENVTDINAYGVAQPNVRNFYYYQNLLVISISPNGDIDWHDVVRKDQVTVNDMGTFSSYLLCVTPDRLVYIFNDLSRKNWNLSITEINDKGVATNNILVRPQNYEGRMVPQYGDQIAYNQFLIPGLTARGIVLLKVTY